MKETRSNYAVYSWAMWRDLYGGRSCAYPRPEGHVLIYMETFKGGREDGVQHVDFELIHGGRMHRLVQRRQPSERLTETGVLRVATKWAREVGKDGNSGAWWGRAFHRTSGREWRTSTGRPPW